MAFIKSKKLYKSVLAMALAVMCAVCLLPATALAEEPESGPIITVNIQDYSVEVDLSSLDSDDSLLGYQFKKADANGYNNVIGTNRWVYLDDVLAAAIEDTGLSLDDEWTTGKYLTFTVEEGKAYTKYTNFTYENLTAQCYFFESTLKTGAAVVGTGTLTSEKAIIALDYGTAEIASGETAGDTLTVGMINKFDVPRLLWGHPSGSPVDVDGKRLPASITSITIH